MPEMAKKLIRICYDFLPPPQKKIKKSQRAEPIPGKVWPKFKRNREQIFFLTEYVSFWAQKSLKWVSKVSGIDGMQNANICQDKLEAINLNNKLTFQGIVRLQEKVRVHANKNDQKNTKISANVRKYRKSV